jgi:uncharacterized membrane protein
MGAYLLEWLSLFFRWFHVIAGVAWIGASFYFVWLDLSLRKPPQWKTDKGISGDLWAWLTGAAMMSIVYYANATAYLIDPSKIAFTDVGAIATSLLFLFGSYFIYEVIVRSHLGKNALIFSTLIFILLVIASWGSYQLFSDRASFIHIGAILGTVMVGNVFFGIMPAQRALVDTDGIVDYLDAPRAN